MSVYRATKLYESRKISYETSQLSFYKFIQIPPQLLFSLKNYFLFENMGQK